jgi:hypothetical protein
MPINVDTIVDGFPHTTIPPIMGMPNYASIAEVNLRLNANAASVQSNLGNGTLGLLALTVSPAVYTNLSNTAFVVPVNPGPQPVIPAQATTHVLAAVTCEHKENLRIWREYLATDKALNQQVLGAVQEMYYNTLRDRITGYASVTTRQLLDHLCATYGNITPANLADIDAKMKTPFDPSQPIEVLFDQIEDTADLAAAANVAYTAAQIVVYGYNLVFQTGVFIDACRDWRRRPEANITWNQFKIDFALAHQELRESQLTSQGAGYQSANSAMFQGQDTQASNDSWHTQTADALANLATATVSDRSAVSVLTATNSDLSSALSSANSKLATAQADITALKTKVASLQGRETGGQTRYPPRTVRTYTNDNYCWTHGYDIHASHTSTTCKYPREGHKTEATR